MSYFGSGEPLYDCDPGDEYRPPELPLCPKGCGNRLIRRAVDGKCWCVLHSEAFHMDVSEDAMLFAAGLED